uniref:DNA polymerase delta subunit 3 n=2 Tax=Caenorhabditis tropicalis TaxID=1561998 RepID=A0A1I7TFE8_9PELO
MVEKYTKILDDVCDPLTVKSFVNMSSLSRNEAISTLEEYIKLKGEPVWALYEVSGTVDSSEYSFLPAGVIMTKHVVVPESSLQETKSKFIEVYSTCLHSIQRTNPKATRVYGRSWASNDDLKGKTIPQQEKRQRAVESSTVEVKKERSAEPEPKPTSSSSSKPVTETKKNKIAPLKKQANLNMFTKKTEIKEKSQSPPPPEREKKSRKRPMIEVDGIEEVSEIDEKKQKTPEKKSKKKVIESPESDGFPSSREQSVEKEMSPPAKRKKSGVNDENKKAKKRLIITDSDDEVATGPTKKHIEEQPRKSEERRRTTRIEKVVESYVDEDGYLVSKEVQKAVECSPQKLSPEKPKEKVITAPIPGAAKVPKKNSTITSFFKKT